MPRLPRNIFKRGGRYYLRVQVEGREIRRSLGPNLQEARRLAALELHRLKQPEAAHVDPTLFSSVTERWLKEVVPLNRNAQGQRQMGQKARNHYLPILGPLPIATITAAHLRAVRAATEARGVSASFVYEIMSDVRQVLRWATEERILDRTPWIKGLLPKIPQRGPDRLDDATVEKVLAVLSGHRLLMARLALLTGLRYGELINLQWRHVVKKPRPHLIVELTKSNRVRRVPLVPEAFEIIEELRESTSSVFVCPERRMNAWDLVRPTGIKWHWHQLRHTFACRYLEAGGRLSALQRILGHATSRMTERYAALSDEAVFDDAERIAFGIPSTVGTNGGSPQPEEDEEAAQG